MMWKDFRSCTANHLKTSCTLAWPHCFCSLELYFFCSTYNHDQSTSDSKPYIAVRIYRLHSEVFPQLANLFVVFCFPDQFCSFKFLIFSSILFSTPENVPLFYWDFSWPVCVFRWASGGAAGKGSLIPEDLTACSCFYVFHCQAC